jgi:hypothetical protein
MFTLEYRRALKFVQTMPVTRFGIGSDWIAKSDLVRWLESAIKNWPAIPLIEPPTGAARSSVSSEPPPAVCDCGSVSTQCSSCAVADWQAAHPECLTCCPVRGAAVSESPVSPETKGKS